MRRALPLAALSGLLLAAALPQAIPWIGLHELDPAGHLEWLAWVGLLPALLALDRARTAGGAAAVGLAAGVAYGYAAVWWVNHAMTAFGGVPFVLAVLGLTVVVLYLAAHWALAFAVGFTVRRRLGWPLWIHLPLTWAATEWLRNYALSGFPWGDLGYLQARHLVVAQLASVTGVYGIAALVVLVNCALHALVRARLERGPAPWRALAVTGGALAAVLAYGAAHLAAVQARARAAPRLAVALVQGNVNQAIKNQGREYADYILGRYLPLTLEADRRGVDLVAWPEATYPYLLPPDLRTFGDPRMGLPRLERAHLLLGAPTFVQRWVDGRRELEGANTVFLLTPDLRVLGSYSKHHLVPFGEYVPGFLSRLLRSVVPLMVQQRPGSALRVLSFPAPGPTPAGSDARLAPATSRLAPAAPEARLAPAAPEVRLAPAAPEVRLAPAAPEARLAPAAPEVRLAPMICFDAIFPEINVAFAAGDPEVLVNPTNDAWYGYSSGPYQFLAMVRMRAIEAERAVVRPAYAGVSALIDPTGAVQPGALPVGPVDPELAPDPDEGPRLLVGTVPRLHGRTLYTRFGDLFAGAASACALTALALALRRGRPGPPPGAAP